jgi:small subunit ribosomal protein S17
MLSESPRRHRSSSSSSSRALVRTDAPLDRSTIVMFATTSTAARAQFTSTPTLARASHRARAVAVTTRVDAAAQTLEGVVVAVSGAKSKTLRVDRKVPHPKYIKRVNVSKKFMFHDEDEACKVGDRVEIVACRPMSRAKRFTLQRVVTECTEGVDCAVA